MTKLVSVSMLGVLAVLAGCSASTDSSATGTGSNDIVVQSLWNDQVEVHDDYLSFPKAARTNADLTKALTQLQNYLGAYNAAKSNAPATAKGNADEEDDFAVNSLRDNNSLLPVYFFGGRQTGALNDDGSVKDGLKNPIGYLRRGVSWSDGPNGELLVQTRPASIAEAHIDIEARGLMPGVAHSANGGDGTNDNWSWGQVYPFTVADVPLNKTLYSHQIGAALGSVNVGFVDSNLKITGNLDSSVSGRWVSPRQAHGILNLNLEGQIVLQGQFDGGYGTSSGDISLFHKAFDITSVGGFPLTLSFDIVGKCDMATNGKITARAGEKVVGGLAGGAKYERDGAGFGVVWTPSWPQFAPIAPTVTSSAIVEASCTVTVSSHVQLFDTGGPSAQAAAFVKLNANGQTSGTSGSGKATIVGGIDASAGGTLAPFGVTLGTISTPAFHKEWTIFDQPVAFSAGQ